MSNRDDAGSFWARILAIAMNSADVEYDNIQPIVGLTLSAVNWKTKTLRISYE